MFQKISNLPIQQYGLNLYLCIYQFILFIWSIFYKYWGPVHLMYFINNSTAKNITLFYYFYCLNKYKRGLYYCKILNKNRIDHITFQGDINQVKNIQLLDEHPYRKRKNITLLNDGDIVHFDLNILDNYMHNTQTTNKVVLCPKDVLKCLGIECTDVEYIEFSPFRKSVRPINDVTFNDFYDWKIQDMIMILHLLKYIIPKESQLMAELKIWCD